MKVKSIIASLLLIVASMQTANAQKVVLKKTDGSSVVCNVSELNSIDFIEAGSWLVTKIVLSETSVTLEPDEIKTLSATVFPEDADNKAVSWESSNEDVAEVNKNGRIIANGIGNCVITCTAMDGSGVKAKCTVQVIYLVTSIKLNKTSLELSLPNNKSQQLEAEILPANATNKAVTWSSSNTAIATVDQTGKVTAVKEGNCTITCTATDGTNIKGTCSVTVKDNTHGSTNGHEWVDLGLPSGTLWATMNVGANSPEQYGNYYAWGETTTKSSYGWSTYKYSTGSQDMLKMTKYCVKSSDGTPDNKTELEPIDDAATVNWGNGWQMPSWDQLVELYDSSYTTTTWTRKSGVYGYKIMSNSNGNYIFLPANHDDSSVPVGQYWSRSLYTTASMYACYLLFGPTYITAKISNVPRHDYRFSGNGVRPVRKK